MKKQFLLIVTGLLLVFTAAQAAWAFSDTANDPNASKIEALQQAGILAGEAGGTFNPSGQLTYAQGVSMIVKGLDLNLDTIRFIKAPQATDYYPNLKNDAWYSSAFIIAALNGLDVPQDVKADQPMTREQFTHHLYKGILRTGDYAFIDLYATFKDEADVDKGYMEAVQKLLITKIAALDESQAFHPKAVITRGEAAGWLHGAIAFVKDSVQPPAEEPGSPLTAVKLATVAVNDKVNEVTVTATAPHPGYGIRIASIAFEGGSAVIRTEPVLPDPDKMYPQVLTDVSAVTYISASYTPVLAENGGGVSGSTGSAGAVDTDEAGGDASVSSAS